ncbi:transcription factor NAI1 [Punica granatum]|uniref:Transcription factor NAI1 n=2 Tax=Punica granatum TaxID=22663 RepID=A0A6P8CJD9_PUNGR|nr:transcription factor NAI1 [Punica granatum]XP_031381517.1 transcription factor NAI1 [Punica granatum]XP_031381518.1 transcription factor NAI1 [Punica granatum]OWM79362.1 hypothetical protein CDL15_Pgr003535 [Punica granatum]PKI53011.1 hypothetical protein CRG98_026591 [Punica granatum]
MSSLTKISNPTEETSPYLDVSLEDLDDLWPLLDDQENLVATQPESSNIETYQNDGSFLLSPHHQTANADVNNNSCLLPREHGSTPVPTMNNDPIVGQQLEGQEQDTVPLTGSGIMAQGLLYINTPVEDALCNEENAAFAKISHADQKGKGKAVGGIQIDSPESAETGHRLSRRTRTGRKAADKQHQLQTDGKDGSTVDKKQDHNAKERVRRMKLNASYLALGALLPQSRRSKKRWSAPMVVDKMVEYIPELKREIEELTSEKEKMLDQKREVVDNRICRTSETTSDSTDQLECCPITVSVHEVKSGELIIQICTKKKKNRKEGEEDNSVFSSMMSNFEAKGLSISSASTLNVGGDRICYHLHVQMNGSSDGPDYTAILKENVVSWLTGPSSS